MRKYFYILLLLLLAYTPFLRAEVVVLQSGGEVRGTIVFQNEEVVIVQSSQGARYQYPQSEVKEIRQETDDTDGVQKEDIREEQYVSAKRASVAVEAVVLWSGGEVRGKIVVQNEEMVIVQSAQGERYQYPLSEVKEIRQEAIVIKEDIREEQYVSAKRVSVAVEVAGGGAFLPNNDVPAAGFATIDLLVGTHNLLGRGIFLGGGIGYLGDFYDKEKAAGTVLKQQYAFLPLMLVVRMPLLQGKHAPMLGAQAGYGVALSKEYKGGAHAGLNVGYCYRISERQRLYVAAEVSLQQAFMPIAEQITDKEGTYSYTRDAGSCFVHCGVRVGIFL